MKSDSVINKFIDAFPCHFGISLGLQETWRYGNENVEEGGFSFLGFGPDTQQGRGSGGVGVLFSHVATLAWRVTAPNNLLYNDFGSRAMAVRMLNKDQDLGSLIRRF